jgi:hypothetical protein
LTSAKSFLCDFLLIWNWETFLKDLQNQKGCKTLVEINTLVLKYLKTALNKATRLCDVTLALEDLKMYKEAEKRL